MENHNFLIGKTHYKWPFSIAMLVYQRVYRNGGLQLRKASILSGTTRRLSERLNGVVFLPLGKYINTLQ